MVERKLDSRRIVTPKKYQRFVRIESPPISLMGYTYGI